MTFETIDKLHKIDIEINWEEIVIISAFNKVARECSDF